MPFRSQGRGTTTSAFHGLQEDPAPARVALAPTVRERQTYLWQSQCEPLAGGCGIPAKTSSRRGTLKELSHYSCPVAPYGFVKHESGLPL